MESSNCVAFFISPHGFGHAARSTAIIQALHQIRADIDIHIFTRVPPWFFDNSLPFKYQYHDCLTDIGLVQSTPLEEDLDETIKKLANFIPFQEGSLLEVSDFLKRLHCQLVVCDISPFGIAAAHSARIPSVLVENFTWDWIYKGYLQQKPEFTPFIDELKQLFQSADTHIQTHPICAPDSLADLHTRPVARPSRTSKEDIRRQLHIPNSSRMVLITMGGFELKYDFLDGVAENKDLWFVIPGGAATFTISKNLVLIPHHSNFYHPDLVHASDTVISKAGYSTISEVYYAGVPFGYVSRDHFRESSVLSTFVQKEMKGLEIDGRTFQTGDWVKQIPDLVQMEHIERKGPLGADQAARFLYENYLRAPR